MRWSKLAKHMHTIPELQGKTKWEGEKGEGGTGAHGPRKEGSNCMGHRTGKKTADDDVPARKTRMTISTSTNWWCFLCMVRFATALVDRMGACSGSIMEVSPPYAPCVVVGRTRDPREDKTHVVDVCTTWDIKGNEDSVICLHRDCVREWRRLFKQAYR